MSKEQLEEHIVRLREELDREREERNYFQLERDKIHTFWEITKRQLEESKSELRNRDREIEEAGERHQEEIKVYKQKMKHLLYEHQNNISELKAEGVISTKLLQSEHAGSENELRTGMQALKVDAKKQELSNETAIKELKLKHEEELTKITDSFESQVREIKAIYTREMDCLREKQEKLKKTEISDIENRMNSQITTLIKKHNKAFSDMEAYFSNSTQESESTYKTLKKQLEEMKMKQKQLERDMSKVMHENKRLIEPLQKAQREVPELQKQLVNFEKDKDLLATSKTHLKFKEKEMEDLKWEHEVLQQMFSKIQLERDELHKKFTQAVLKVQQKSGFKSLLLERKLGALTDTLEKKEAQLYAVLSASNMDQTALAGVTDKLEEVLDSKNISIQDLQHELARVCKAHDDLLQTYEVKLRAFGIPVEELGFKPLQSSLAGRTLGPGPAGLLSATK
ncbi:dynein regulatory complex subunit 4-like [Myripristis murdjan]|uniref:dynein regulatory complex subunit 4-like n=1 Tax=Myripristis murdjan TaxID=586833 RepID=UPI0011761BF4|nr:dynein regulatory complex subunit 4-like [Myripristis murdjan]